MNRAFLVIAGFCLLVSGACAQLSVTPTAPISVGIGPWTKFLNTSVTQTTSGNIGVIDVIVSGSGSIPNTDINSMPSNHFELGYYQGLNLATGAGQVTIDAYTVSVNHTYTISTDNSNWSQTNGVATMTHGSVFLDNELFTPFSVGSGTHTDNRTATIGAGTTMLTNDSGYQINVGNLLYSGTFDSFNSHFSTISYDGMNNPYTGVHFQLKYHVVPEPMTLTALSLGLMLVRKRRKAL